MPRRRPAPGRVGHSRLRRRLDRSASRSRVAPERRRVRLLDGVRAGPTYSLDGSDMVQGDTVEVSADGTHTIAYASPRRRRATPRTRPRRSGSTRTRPVTDDDAPRAWTTGPVTVHLTAADAVSGVASTRSTLDGGRRRATRDPLHVSGRGHAHDRYASTDVAGNTEATKTAHVSAIDNTAPTTTDDAPGLGAGQSLVTSTRRRGLAAFDRVRYSLDGSGRPSPTPAVDVIGEGRTTLNYAAIDLRATSRPHDGGAHRRHGACDPDDAPAAGSHGPVDVTLVVHRHASGVSRHPLRPRRLGRQTYTAPDASGPRARTRRPTPPPTSRATPRPRKTAPCGSTTRRP